jgi:hypothetical protein
MAETRQGALFSLGSVQSSDRHRYSIPPDRRGEHQLLDALFDLAETSPDHAVDMRSMEERLGIRRPSILKSVARLLATGVLQKCEIDYYPGRRGVTLYVLITADQLPAAETAPVLPASPPPQMNLPMGGDLLRQAVQLRYDAMLDRNVPWKGERLIVFNLTALLRNGRTGETRQVIQAEVRQGKRYCLMEARAPEGTMIAGVLDLRPLVVLLTLVRQHLRSLDGRPAKNLFAISLRDICDAMAMKPSSSNCRAVFAQIFRWWRTTYLSIDNIYGMFDWAPNVFDAGVGFSVITSIEYISWIGQEGVTPEIIQIRLYEPIYEALLESDRALSVHREIVQDRQPHPLRHKLYYWSRRVVQHQHEPKEFLLDHIRAEIDPLKKLPEFRREFREGLSPESQNGQSFRARIPGYLLGYQPNRSRPKYDIVLIAADPQDPVVGEGSAYAQRQITQE